MSKLLKLSFLFVLLLILNSCFYVANSPPNKKINMNDAKSMYRQLHVSLFDDINKVKKTAKAYAPYGHFSYAYAVTVDENTSQISKWKSSHYIGYGYNPDQSKKRALEFCKKNNNHWKKKKILGLDIPGAKIARTQKCKLVLSERFNKKRTKKQIEYEKKYFSSTQRCLDLGIVDYPEHLNCVNSFEKTRMEVQNSSSSSISVAEILVSLLLLDSAISSLQPSSINSEVTCMMSSTALTGSGGLNGITCN